MHSFLTRSSTFAGRAFLAGAALFGLCLCVASAGDGSDSGFSTDPTVGTLPMHAGGVPDLAGVDQVVYLHGSVEALRAALADDVFFVDHLPGAAASGIWALPGDRAWVEFHGTFTLRWRDPAVLAGLELGVGTGFEGGGMVCVVESLAGTTAPSALQVGRSIPVAPERLHDAGLLERPVLLHGLHATGARTEVVFSAPSTGGFTVQQRL